MRVSGYDVVSRRDVSPVATVLGETVVSRAKAGLERA